ncbi:TIR domain-containing protein [Seonamhaeicola sp. ML3]|uniref:TIR domain-containing protein n=1 Tax=Seonamhaeicola sp. ML3 TaxID=2937786 RepID=UPI00200E9A9D|nr:TIR domain-containing protein [Seonamhaeicola sp. ML3]
MDNETKKSSWLPLIISIGGVLLFANLISKLIDYLISNQLNEDESHILERKQRKPRIFVSHSWKHNKDYNNLIKGFEKQGFNYYNHSISLDKAEDLKNEKEIENKIKNQLLYSRCLLVLGGSYSNKYWIKKEVEIAKSLGKKVIAVRPWNTNKVPKYLEKTADEIIGFNSKAIIEKIK